jgi:hypothetical protein
MTDSHVSCLFADSVAPLVRLPAVPADVRPLARVLEPEWVEVVVWADLPSVCYRLKFLSGFSPYRVWFLCHAVTASSAVRMLSTAALKKENNLLGKCMRHFSTD